VIVLGIDAGTSGIKSAPVDLDTGRLTAERVRVDTPEAGAPEAVAAVVGELVRHFTWSGPLGCGLPLVVRNGVVATRRNLAERRIGPDASGCCATRPAGRRPC
jgi:polyphosphate glucokinase